MLLFYRPIFFFPLAHFFNFGHPETPLQFFFEWFSFVAARNIRVVVGQIETTPLTEYRSNFYSFEVPSS